MALSLQRYTWATGNSHLSQFLKERSRKERERSMLIAVQKLDHLPKDLIIEILSWLPVKDLLQYKSVCKSWHAIISSPDFISKHLKNYYNNNDDWRDCLLVQHSVSHGEIQVYELFVDETSRVLANEVLYSIPIYSSYLCGPCDGLYYFCSGRALWNPAINEFKRLPKLICMPDLSPMFTYSPYEVYGFGLDPVTGDYKVVVVKEYLSTTDDDSNVRPPPSVLVYSLRTNSWKYCGDLAKNYYLEINRCYIYVNGCCYWFGSYEFTSDVIISFDMATDAYKEISVPDYTQPSSKCLAMYDDSLAFLALSDDEKILDIWTWNEVSWTIKLSVGPFPDVRGPVGHWKSNRLILQCEYGQLVLLDPETHDLKDLGFQFHRWCEGVYAYMESLVSIKDENEPGQSEEVEAENKITKQRIVSSMAS